MAEGCSILYNGGKTAYRTLQIAFGSAVRKGDLTLFTSYLAQSYMQAQENQTVRIVASLADSKSDAERSYKKLLDDVSKIITDYDNTSGNAAYKPVLMPKVLEALRANDEMQIYTKESDNDIKTLTEGMERNSEELEINLNSFFGAESTGIQQMLEDSFQDKIYAEAFWNQAKGTWSDGQDSSLNNSIARVKEDMFGVMVRWLKENFPQNAAVEKLSERMYMGRSLDIVNYNAAMTVFYNLTKGNSVLRNRYEDDYRNAVGSRNSPEKEIAYRKMLETLCEDDGFMTKMRRRFGRKKVVLDNVMHTLYSADEIAEHYYEIKKLAFDHLKELSDKESNALGLSVKGRADLADERKAKYENYKKRLDAFSTAYYEGVKVIESQSRTALDAAMSYMMLQHFDSLLMKKIGDKISVRRGQRGIETGSRRKYYYGSEKGHQVVNWNEEDDIGAEKHISKFVEAAIRSVRLYDYESGTYMMRRLNPTILAQSWEGLAHAVLEGRFRLSDNTLNAQLRQAFTLFQDDPVGNTKKILDILFKPIEEKGKSTVIPVDTRRYSDKDNSIDKQNMTFSDYNLSVLWSFFECFFNSDKSTSVYSAMIGERGNPGEIPTQIISEMAGFLNRNNQLNYLVSKEGWDGTEVRAKKRFFDDPQIFRMRQSINSYVNTLSMDRRNEINSKYNFAVDFTENEARGRTYGVTIGANAKNEGGVEIRITTYSDQFIFDSMGPNDTIEGPEGYFDSIKNASVLELRKKLMLGQELDSDERRLSDLLQFIDDALGTGIMLNPDYNLRVLDTYKNSYKSFQKMDNYMMPLIKMAVSAMYANSVYIKAGDESLESYFTNNSNSKSGNGSNDEETKWLSNFTNPGKSDPLEKSLRLLFRIAPYADRTIERWVKARMTVNGDVSKAYTKDCENNNIPNTGVSCLGAKASYYLSKQGAGDSNVNGLLFAGRKSKHIVSTCVDQEAYNISGKGKKVSAFSTKELFHHTIFNKFWGRYEDSERKNIVVQATSYSDKTTFYNWEISQKFFSEYSMRNDISFANAREDEIVEVYKQTLGDAAKKISDEYLRKMAAITRAYADNNPEIMSSLRPEGNAAVIREDGSIDERMVNDIMSRMDVDTLVRTAQSIGETVEEVRDYRTVDGGRGTALNTMMSDLEELYNDSEKLKKALSRERGLFVRNLLDNNARFQALTHGDSKSAYMGSGAEENTRSRNSVMRAIKTWCKANNKSLSEFVDKWVDGKTGALLIARQDGKNILSVADNFDEAGNVELCPVLEQFFLVEGLASNNLRVSLTGFETNHASGKNSPLRQLATLNSEEKRNEFMMLYGTLDDEELAAACKLAAKDEYSVKLLVEGKASANDLVKGLGLSAEEESNVVEFLGRVLDNNKFYNFNTAQGTQYKRNVIVSATLQYVTQNMGTGVPPKIRCAVINDVEAPVFNYRGTREKAVSPHDGSAWVTPFQNILERHSLGTQAGGTVNKPIWHSYDSKGGTAFMAKYATYTMTNELMRMSLNSEISLYSLFRRMTDMRWDNADDIDLTRPYWMDASYDEYDGEYADDNRKRFCDMVFGKDGLHYKNKYGDVQKIMSIGSEIVLSDAGEDSENEMMVYYTLERNMKSGADRKVYHLFYDTESEKAVHVRVTGESQEAFNEAFVRIREAGGKAHTISSLFELHSALGGLDCCDENGKWSERNNEVVVNFMNYVAKPKNGTDLGSYRNVLNQSNFDQVLKKYQIGYALNSSAVKEGRKNINQSSAWSDNSELNWFEVDSAGLGLQLNAAHDIEGSKITEFTQVIAACAAYGYTYNNSSELYLSLAKEAMDSSKVITDAVDKWMAGADENERNAAKSALYEAIGRIIFADERIGIKRKNLAEIIRRGVMGVFNKQSDHGNDSFKIPLSDLNINSDFIAQLASTITKQSIKRKHPGSGNVICPSYNIIQYYMVTDANGVTERLMSTDMLSRAKADYKKELFEFLMQSGASFHDGIYTVQIDGQTTNISSSASLAELEWLALRIDSTGSFSSYYSDREGVEWQRHMISAWIARNESNSETYSDRSYFVPTDVVDVIDSEGNVKETVSLDTMETYRNFKKGKLPSGINCAESDTYRISARRGHNLRPSLIRWKYNDNGVERYMNYFDLPVVWDVVEGRTEFGSKHRKRVQKTLDDLEAGYFEMEEDDGKGGKKIVRREIVKGSLENKAAEMVQSDIYADVFGTRGSSLADVIAGGVHYFYEKAIALSAPLATDHDLALVRQDGEHTLVRFSEPDADTARLVPINSTVVKDDGSVMYNKGGNDLFMVGKWLKADNVIWNSSTKMFERTDDKWNLIVDQSRYRLEGDDVQEYVPLVRRYSMPVKEKANGDDGIRQLTLYSIASDDVFSRVYSTDDASKIAAAKADLVRGIWDTGDYSFAEVNTKKDVGEESSSLYSAVLDRIMEDTSLTEEARACMDSQKNSLGESTATRAEMLEEAIDNYMRRLAHDRWVSFQDSLKFIASRIPAQTLQSFMPMQVVGWTENSGNVSFVSHFQIFLQGSDYDIDKAYVMGQNYSSSSVYVGWSPFFNMSTLSTLEASKKLTMPKGYDVAMTRDGGSDMTDAINALAKVSSLNDQTGMLEAKSRSENDIVDFISALADALHVLERGEGVFHYNGTLSDDVVEAAARVFEIHEKHVMPDSVSMKGYKNITSANIWAVAHDVRNRDQAYTAITMGDVRSASEQSPKGLETLRLNTLNPLAKYVMQRHNLTGKSVVGICANGEKYFFNAYWYCSDILRRGDSSKYKYMTFNNTFSRIKGRAKGNPEENSTTHLPDLYYDERIKEVLISEFGATESSLEYKYVDQMISQLLSAATDNAKELVLSRINAGSDFAKMYLFLMINGYGIDDIAAFMTSDVAEFISTRSGENFFSTTDRSSAYSAVNDANCIVRSSDYLHGKVYSIMEDGLPDYSSSKAKWVYMRDEILNALGGNKKGVSAEKLLTLIGKMPDLTEKDGKALTEKERANLLEKEFSALTLDDMMRSVILLSAQTGKSFQELDMYPISVYEVDEDMVSYIQHCEDLARNVRYYISKSPGENALENFLADAEEFRKVFYLSDEMSQATSAFLAFNQGLPTSQTDILLSLNKISRLFNAREVAVGGVKDSVLFSEPETDSQQKTKDRAWTDLVSAILANHPDYTKEYVVKCITDAHEKGMINNMDAYMLITDRSYWDTAKEYLNCLRGGINILDMMDTIPHYRETIKLYRDLLCATDRLSLKGRMLRDITKEHLSTQFTTDDIARGVIRFVDNMSSYSYIRQLPYFVTHKNVKGFDENYDLVDKAGFDFDSFEDIHSFKRFFETEFYEWLLANHSDNTLVRHLIKGYDAGRPVMVFDIDLSNPDESVYSSNAYDEITRGIDEFAKVMYNEEYSVADIFQLYNLMISRNGTGSDRMTSIFRNADSEDCLLGRYFRYIGDSDYDESYMPEYSLTDFLINSAPLISEYAEKYAKYPFIKVKDDNYGYTVKSFDRNDNCYYDYPFLPVGIDQMENVEIKRQRLTNYIENRVFELPEQSMSDSMKRLILYDDGTEPTPEQKDGIRKIFNNLFISNRIGIRKYNETAIINGIEHKGDTKAEISAQMYDKESKMFVIRTCSFKVSEKWESTIENAVDLVCSQNLNRRKVVYDILRNSRKNGEFAVSSLEDFTHDPDSKNDSDGKRRRVSLTSNMSVQGMVEKWPDLEDMINISPKREAKVRIMYCTSFKGMGNVNYAGRVLDGFGSEIFVIGNYYDAVKLVGYLNTREKIESSFEKGGQKEEAIEKNMADLKEIAKARGLGVKETLLDYLNNKRSYSNNDLFYGSKPYNVPIKAGNRTISPRLVLGNIVAELGGSFNEEQKYTAMELAINDIRIDKDAKDDKGRRLKDYKLDIHELWWVLNDHNPELSERMDFRTFVNLGKDEMQELFTGKNGLFLSHPKLRGATVQKIDGVKSKISKMVSTVREKVYVKDVKEQWESVTNLAKEKGLQMPPEKLPSGMKAYEYAQSWVSFFNELGYQWKSSDGLLYTLQVQNDTSAAADKPSYSYYIQKSYTPDGKQIKPGEELTDFGMDRSDHGNYGTITLTFPSRTIGELYDFAYDTGYYFGLDTGAKTVNGKYKGFYLYSGPNPDGTKVWKVSRDIINPNDKTGKFFASRDAALHEIDKIFENESIESESRLGIHLDANKRFVELNSDGVTAGGYITVLNTDMIEGMSLDNISSEVKSILKGSVGDFQEMLGGLEGIKSVDTAEKAAMFLVRYYSDRTGGTEGIERAKNFKSRNGKERFIEDILGDGKERAQEIIKEMNACQTVTYSLERSEWNSGVKKGVLHRMLKDKQSVDTSGKKVGNIDVSEYFGQNIRETASHLKKQYGINVTVMSNETLAEYSRENGLGIEDRVRGVKAFVHNGMIIINSSAATPSDIYHEVAHLFLGVLKTGNMDDYRKVIGKYMQEKGFAYRYKSARGMYRGMADEDIVEEAVAEMVALNITRDGAFIDGFKGTAFDTLMQSIMSTATEFIGKIETDANGLGFTGYLKTLLNEREGSMKRRRKLTNLVKMMIGNGEVIMTC